MWVSWPGRCSPSAAGRAAAADSDCRSVLDGVFEYAGMVFPDIQKPNEFGYVTQLTEVTENTRRKARGLILPASTQVGNPAENTLLPRPSPNYNDSGSGRARSRSTAASWPARPTKRSSRSTPTACSSLAARNPDPNVPAPAPALPNRRRRTDQPPQTPLRHGPQPPQGRRRPADLDRVGDPRLQRRHARRPNR